MRRILFLLMIVVLVIGIVGCASENKSKKEFAANQPSKDGLSGYLQELNNDEISKNPVYNDMYYEDSIRRIAQIKEALKSFRELTEASRDVIPEGKLNEIGNTSVEIQNIGFNNWTNSTQGVLIKQNYQITKLEFQLALNEFENNKISKEDVENKKTMYLKAKEDLENFLANTGFVD